MGYVSGYRMHSSHCVMSQALILPSPFTSPGPGVAVGDGVGDAVGDAVGVYGQHVNVGVALGVGDTLGDMVDEGEGVAHG